MRKRLLNGSPAYALGIVSLTVACGLTSQAADRTWTGGSSTSANWSDAANWNGLPANGDNAIFSGYNQIASTNDFPNLSLGWLQLGSVSFSLYGNPLTLTAGITNVPGDNLIGMNVTFSGAQAIESDAGTLTFAGMLTNTSTLTVQGWGNVAWNNAAATPLGLKGTGDLVKNDGGTLTIGGGWQYGVASANFLGNTIVNGGYLNFNVGCFDGNSPMGQSLTINPGASVSTSQPHVAGYNGRPVSIYGGTLNMNSEAYFTSFVLSNATVNGPGDIRGSGSFTNLASAGTTVWTAPLNLTSSRTIGVALGTADPAITFQGSGNAAIQGSGTLTKAGPGKMAIAGADTHTGSTIISAGTLALSGGGSLANSPTINVASNAVFDISAAYFSLNTNQTLSGFGTVVGTLYDYNAGAFITPGGSQAAGTLTIDGLSLSGNTILNFDIANALTVGGNVNDLLVVTNLTLATGVTNFINFSFLNGTPAIGTYTLIKYTYGPPAGAVTTLAASASRYTYAFSSDGSSIKVTVTGAPAPLVWKGDSLTNAWDIGITANWMNGATKDFFLQGDNATFTDTGSASPAVNISAAVQPTTVTVNSTKDYTFAGSGKISDGAKLFKSNSGTLTLLNDNDFTGGGSLAGGPVYVGATPADSPAGGPTGNLGSGNLTNNTTVVFSKTSTTTYSGNMSGSGNLVKLGGGQLNLSGSNALTGGLVINNGTVKIGGDSPVIGARFNGPITNYTALFFSVADPFTLAGNVTSAGNPNQFGAGDISILGNGGMTVDGTASLATGPFGNLNVGQSAFGKLTVAPGGVVNVGALLLLGNPASYSGAVVQTGGTVNVTNLVRVGHWGSEISTYTMSGGTLNVPNAQLAVGWDGIGLFNLSGGTINCRALNVDDNSATSAINGTNSTFTMTGGNVNIGPGGMGGNTATFLLGGGTIAAPAFNWSSSKAMILTNSGPTFDSAGNTITLSGILSGNGALTKQGTGVLQLDGVNTYTNVTTVAAGRLQGGGTISGPVVVNSGAVLSAGGTLTRGTLTVSNSVTVNPGASLLIDQASTALSSDLLRVIGNVSLDPAGTPIAVNFTGGLPYTGGANVILTNSGVRTGTLTYSNPTRYVATLDQSNPNYVTLAFSGTNAALVWKGNVNSLWDVNATANWSNAGAADKYYQSDAVLFDSTGLATPNVTLAADMTPASVNVNAAGNYTLAGGAIAGVGSLTKNGAGTLTLANNNTYTGGTYVNAGTLQLGNGATSGSVSGNIYNQATVLFNRADNSLFGGVVSGPGNLVAAGTGTLTLTADQTHTGGSIVNPGATVQLGLGAVVDAGSLGNTTVANNGSVIFYRNGSPVNVTASYTGTGSLLFQGTGLSGQSAFSMNATNTFTGPVTLSLARLQTGVGAYGFGNPSSITVQQGSQVYATVPGTTGIYTNAGYRIYNIPLTLSGTGWREGTGQLGALRLNSGALWAGPLTLAANTRITAYGDGNDNRITGTIAGGSYELETGFSGGTSALLTLSPASPNRFGSLRLSVGTLVADNTNALPNGIPFVMNGGTLRLNGVSFTTSNYLSTAVGTIQNGSSSSPASFTFTTDPVLGTMTFGALGETGTQPLHVTWNGTGTALTLGSASATWTGNLTNNGGAILTSGQNTYFGNNNVPNRFLVANNGGSFTWNINNVFGNGTGNSFFPTIILNPGCAVSNNNYNVIGPVVLNGAALTGNRTGGSSWQMYQFRGPVTVLGTTPSTISNVAGTTSNGDHLDTATVFTVADVTGNANSDLIVSVPLLDRSGDYGGTGGLVKQGPGTMELDSPNSYTGSTVVSNGTLKLGPSSSLASANITVASGAKLDASALSGGLTLNAQTLSGSGEVAGNVTDGTGTVLRPGGLGQAGTLTFDNSLTLSGSDTLAIDLANTTTPGGGVNDLLQVNGDLTLSSATPTVVNFRFLNGAPATGTYRLIKYSGNLYGSVAGAFTNTTRYVASFSVDTVNKAILVSFSGAAGNLVWTGSDPVTPAIWDIATSSNWSDGTTSTLFYQLDAVRFDDSSVNTAVTLSATVTPASITVDSTRDYVIGGSGTLSGPTGLTKNNTGSLTLTMANNDFTGPIVVNGGAFKLGAASAVPRGAAITVAPNAQFDYAGFGNDSTRGYSFSVGGSGPDGSGAIINSGGGVYSYASISNLVLTSDTVLGGNNGRWDIGLQTNTTVNGNGYSLTKVGSCQLELRSQLLTNLASVVVSNGLLVYENWDQTNSWTATTTNFVKPGASLGIYGGRQFNLPIVLDSATIQSQGGGTPLWLSPITLASSSTFNNSAAQNFYGPISGPGALWVSGGTSALTLTNINAYTGGTTISNAPYTPTNSSGTVGNAALLVANPAALGSGPLNLNLGATTINSMTNVLRPVEFNLTAGGVVTNDILLPTTLITNLALQGRDNTSVFTLAGKLTGGYASLTNWLDFGNSGSVGVLRLSNPANDFVVKVLNVNRGVLAITADSVLGNSANLLRLDQGTSASGLRFDAPGLTVAHNILVNSSTAFDLFGDNNGDGLQDTVNNVTLSGTLSGGGTVYLRGTNGVLTLSGNNSCSGGFEMAQPVTLQVAASANLGTAYIGLKQRGTFRYTGTGSETMTRNIWADTGLGGGGGTIDIPNASASLTWNPGGGTINQPVTKTGAGALTLGGSVGISGGALSVNGGTLTVNSSVSGFTPVSVTGSTLFVNGSVGPSCTVNVGLSGVLGGNGTFNGPVAINAGGALQPGVNGFGKLAINSVLSLGGTTTMKINKTANTNDVIVGLTSVSYGGTLLVNNLGSQSDLTNGTRFVLFSAVAYQGSFGSIILPILDSGLQWDASMLSVDGSIRVVSPSLPTTPTNVGYSISGGNLNLSWPSNYTGWLLLEQTNNLNLGVSTNHADWSLVPGADTTNQVSIPLDKTRRDAFYRLVRPPYNP